MIQNESLKKHENHKRNANANPSIGSDYEWSTPGNKKQIIYLGIIVNIK